MVSPFCAGTRRRGRVLESFNSARSSGLLRDRRAEQTTQITAAKERGEPRETTTTTHHKERPQVVVPGDSRRDGVRTQLLTCPVVGVGRRGRRGPGEGRGGAGTEGGGGGGFRGVTFGTKPVLTNWEDQEQS